MSHPAKVSTYGQIFWFWIPLAASWLLMSAEGPILQAVIARMSDMQRQLAAFGIVMSLEIAIESPVIMLLATSTSLATNARNYLTLRRFMLCLNLTVTIEAILVAYTPLYGLIVRDVMGIPEAIAAAAQPGMKIMFLWSAAIGFRRFLQGVLIRHGQTRWIGYGTLARLLSSGGGGIILGICTNLPGVWLGSIALLSGVIMEALFVATVARPTIKKLLSATMSRGSEDVSFWGIAKYHLPLAATSLLTLLAQPVIGAGLARMPFPEENLAAWPIIWGLLFIFRSPAFALPEAVIALGAQTGLKDMVRVFCLRIGMASSSAMAILVVTPLSGLYLAYVAGLPDRLAHFVVPALIVGLVIPFVNSIHSWYRGLLMAARMTSVIYWGMGMNLALTSLLIMVGVILRTPGAGSAVVALLLSLLVELAYLRAKLPASKPR